MKYPLVWLASLFILVTVKLALAAPEDFNFIEGPAWKESDKALPDYPKDEDLLLLDIDSPSSALKFFIDGTTLALTKDRVVSYTMVIKSDSGAKNVLREGMRCETNSYKVYAYGGVDSNFQPAKEPLWQLITKTGVNAYRNELNLYYLCDKGLPLKPSEIIEHVKHAQFSHSNPNPYVDN